MIPSQNKIEISVKGDTCVLLGVKGLTIQYHFLTTAMNLLRFIEKTLN